MIAAGDARAAPGYRLGLAMLLGATLAWSTTGYFVKLIGLDSATLLAWRSSFGAAGMVLVILTLEGPAGLRRLARMGWTGWAYALISALGAAGYVTSMVHTTVAHVAVIYATVPLLAAGLAWVAMREAPGRSALVTSLVAVAGVAVMVGAGAEGSLAGDAMALGMTLCMAGMIVLSRRSPQTPVLQAALVSCVACALLALPFAGAAQVSPSQIGLMALSGVISLPIGLSLFVLGARYMPSVDSGLVTALEAPLAVLWVWLFLAEVISAATLLGGGLVMAAVTLHLLNTARG